MSDRNEKKKLIIRIKLHDSDQFVHLAVSFVVNEMKKKMPAFSRIANEKQAIRIYGEKCNVEHLI